MLLLMALCVRADGEWADPDLVAKVESGEITEANVSWWGYDATDATPFIRAAIASKARKLTLDGENRSWHTLPLQGRSNLTLIVPKGCELVAKRGEYHKDSSTLLKLDGVTDFTLTGGGTLRMWFEDYTNRNLYAWSEWRHAIQILGSSRVTIENLKVRDSGGDGLCFSSRQKEPENADIVVRDVTFTRNNRQGISLCIGTRILIERCIMEDTCGTLPSDGIDFEPDFPGDPLCDVVVRDCVARRNKGSGFDFSVGNLRAGAPDFSITLENCRSERNAKPTKFHHSDNVVHGFHGSIVFRNCVFDDLDQSRKPFMWLGGRDTLSATFENCFAADPENGGEVTLLGAEYGWRATGRPTTDDGTLVRQLPLTAYNIAIARIHDECPGEAVRLVTMHMIADGTALAYAAGPGHVHLTGLVKKVNDFDFKGATVEVSDMNGRKLATLPTIDEFAKETALDFDAPAKGFYRLKVNSGGHAFRLVESDVPIAWLIPPGTEPALSWNGGPGEAYVRVQEGCERFYLFASGGCGAAYQRAKVYDPNGMLMWDHDDIGCTQRYVSPETPTPGLWKISAELATTYGMYYYSFDVFGVHPFLFLSPEKTWEIPSGAYVTSASIAQSADDRLVTIEYTLANAPAVVTLDIQTNATDGSWASIGGENIQNFTPDSAVWRRIDTDGNHTIGWYPDLSWPDHKIKDGGVRAVVTAWALDNKPSYMVVDLSCASQPNTERYYPAEEFLPGGLLTNPDYRTTSLVMRKIMAKNVTWTMGSVGELGRVGAREAAHPATLTGNYYIGVFEITQAQWESVTDYNNSWFQYPGCKATRPVDYVCYHEIRHSHNDTHDASDGAAYWPGKPYEYSFLGKLRTKTGIDFDLPTESQWEFACRSGRGEGRWNNGEPIVDVVSDPNLPGRSTYNAGDNIDSRCQSASAASLIDDNEGSATVGSYAKNAWGLYDMHGNVYEWCLDYYDDDITSLGGQVNINVNDKTQKANGTGGYSRLIRGGSWRNPAMYARSAYREEVDPGSRFRTYGLRVVCKGELK